VLLALYSLTKRLGSAIGAERGEWCTSAQLEGFTEMVLSTAKDVGFLNDHSPSHMSDLLANLSRRGHLSNRELSILTGLFGQIRKELIRRCKTEM
jgi:tRNA C32,U32 (ribose-2'-O)-methylase TrmJ